jgi:hypothetical protein
MAAPTKPADVKKSLANPEPSTHGPLPPLADKAACPQLARADAASAARPRLARHSPWRRASRVGCQLSPVKYRRTVPTHIRNSASLMRRPAL